MAPPSTQYAELREEITARFEAAELASRAGAAGRPMGSDDDRRGGQGGLRPGVARHPGGIGRPLARAARHRAAGGGTAAAARPMAALSRSGLQRRAAGASPRAAIHQGPRACPRAVPRAGRQESVALFHRLLADDGVVRVPLGRCWSYPAGRLLGWRELQWVVWWPAVPPPFPCCYVCSFSGCTPGPAACHASLFAAAADAAGGGGGPAGGAGNGQERLPPAARRHRRPL